MEDSLIPVGMASTLSDLLRAEFDGRNRTFKAQVAQTKSEMTMKGLGVSGPLISALIGLACQEIAVRSQIIYAQLVRTAEAFGVAIDDEFRPYARSELDRRIRLTLVTEFRGMVHGSASQAMQHVRDKDRVLSEIDLAADRSQRKLFAELDRDIASNKTKRARVEAGASNIFHISGGAVGIIQIGSGNRAESHLHLEQSTIDGFRKILSELESQIANLPDAALTSPKLEILEVIASSSRELQKTSPNATLVISLLAGVAMAIQTVAALQPAYETLKGLLSLVGVNIP